jgi:hypothetical protein
MLGNAELMEAGLVSVLEHRPAGCEVLLVLNGDYGNPYGLEDEVRFVAAPRGAAWAESCNLGVANATAEIVHMLLPGVEVTAGWADEPLRHFVHGDVAAVSPLVLDARRHGRIVAAGVSHGRRRRLISGTYNEEHHTAKLPRTPVLGPSCLAGFYRKSHLETLGGFEPRLGDELADVDFALRIERAGLRSVIEPRSILLAAPPRPSACGFRRGLRSERLLLRHADALGRLTLTRPFAMLLGVVWRMIHPLRALGHLAGQLAAWCELARHRRFRRSQDEIADTIAVPMPTFDDGKTRVDGAHGRVPTRTTKPTRVSA